MEENKLYIQLQAERTCWFGNESQHTIGKIPQVI